jgi:hypothetical protein
MKRNAAKFPRIFNRVKELSLFGSVFKDSPRLSVILGGFNVGKSVLCKQALEDGGHNVAHIDMREEGFSSAYELHLALQEKFPRFSQNMKKCTPKSVEIPDFVRIELPQNTEMYRVGMLSRDLKSFASTIPAWTGKQSNVLFIDEANELKHIPGKEGKEAGRTLLKWCVLNTKQLKRLHVVLASSDSFFLEWLNEMNIERHASVYTVGDLSEDAAAHFYNQLVNEKLPENLKMKLPSFKDVYRVLGGHMFHIDLFISDFAISQGVENLDTFSPLRSAISRIESALLVESADSEWTSEYLKILMEIIARKSFITYKEACDIKQGKAMVKSLIRHNVLLNRHNNKYAFDFPDAPDDPIVCAMSPMERYAMEQVLKLKKL